MRARRQDGTYPLKVTISHKGKTSHMPTGVFLRADQWDGKACKVLNHTRKQFLNSFLQGRLSDITTALLELKAQGSFAGRTITQVRDMVAARLNPEKPLSGFTSFYKEYAERHGNSRTREIYAATWHMIEKFDSNAQTLQFEDITRDWLSRFDLFLQPSSPSRNARNIHFRNIRAVFNAALAEDKTSLYPFRAFKIKPEQTAKRNLKAEQLREVFNASVPHWQQKYVDVFKLQFLLIGINTVDLLNNAMLVDGRIMFNRAKTTRFYSIKVEPEAMEIIQKYRGTSHLLNVADHCKDYRHFANRLNINLHKLMPGLTTYWARHSWATVAAELDIPKDTIAAALGHGGHSVTDIYIDFDMKKVDEANRKVIDYVLYGKR